MLAHQQDFDDIVEVRGGENRISTIAVRRKLQSGGNHDLTTGTDLLEARQQAALCRYFLHMSLHWLCYNHLARPLGHGATTTE